MCFNFNNKLNLKNNDENIVLYTLILVMYMNHEPIRVYYKNGIF